MKLPNKEQWKKHLRKRNPMADLLFPIFLYHEGMQLPDEGTFYVVAGNGIWLHKDNAIGDCFVRIEFPSFLDDFQQKEVSLKLPKIPANLVWQIKQFFQTVTEQHLSESEVTLYFNREKQQYKIFVPYQVVSHSSVRYKMNSLSDDPDFDGYLCVGTIHSHCDFAAFHSGIDIGDEENFDGLHVTFGHNNKQIFSISACVVMNAERYQINPSSVLEGIETKDEKANDFFEIICVPENSEELLQEVKGWMTKVFPNV